MLFQNHLRQPLSISVYSFSSLVSVLLKSWCLNRNFKDIGSWKLEKWLCLWILFSLISLLLLNWLRHSTLAVMTGTIINTLELEVFLSFRYLYRRQWLSLNSDSLRLMQLLGYCSCVMLCTLDSMIGTMLLKTKWQQP